MDEFAMGSSNETSYYGPVHNPWDKGRVPGGSSGGSAAALAARLAVAATGTDTGGSIRQPAALCGITGIKPTYGRISRFGMIAFASSLDQAGPMTRSAEDAALMLQAMAGFDPKDSTSVDEPVPDYSAGLNDSLTGLKIGLPKEYFGAGLDAEVAASVEAAIGEYQKLGAELVEISLPNTALAVPTYYVIAPAECSSNLSRFDGVRFGYRCDDPKDLEDLYKRSRGDGFGDEVKRRIMIGTYALSSGYYDAYYLKAQKTRQLISDDFIQAFKQVDVIMGPTSPTTAFGLGEKADDPVTMYLNDIYTIATNLAGLPGLSMPVEPVNGLPVGLQIIGNYFAEAKLLNVAHRLQQGYKTIRHLASVSSMTLWLTRKGIYHAMGNRHRAGDPCPAGNQIEDLFRGLHRLWRRAQHPGLYRGSGLSRGAAGAQPGGGEHGAEVRPGDRCGDRSSLGVRAQELLLPGSAQGLPDQSVRAAHRRQG
jgi:aspartyl-tRNA(Asn)/glutamyl-tRNA(Gln) amidotransferase subunit A